MKKSLRNIDGTGEHVSIVDLAVLYGASASINERPRSKLRGISRNSVCFEKPRFLMLFLAVTPEQAQRNLND